MITFITGGIKSGKTTFGLSLGSGFKDKAYLATAESFDEEMEKKILLHRAERKGEWKTIEEPLDIVQALEKIKTYEFVLVDCITMWINNLMFYKKEISKETGRLVKYLEISKFKNLAFISNEVGLGLISADKLSREYINLLGMVNQKIASISDKAILMVSGCPLYIK
ncbi:bifunctional adenosylcobinamide kinase/adenosylcobinamide-phosphate guanylyltransferase [Deferribacterales bacterium Es71-Z0220]|uniref:bifunctional adenosylcobinamide kinase/adenosylcobinamide-phosphate guanylyltransferase n=1 Tax=Deferrivibrio essentukiensis TaxID=2880922 RepID=UPI001F606D54|nr:bifunctional adenosylcobinamide kinase/adenosylcobinamide-phosphate guanylyltransferase [Deferrivibrio essentukiensis]MCB4205291.1 bifunctional adenosylcobinamide kinase/adenosylcobinamide-phosphate guanylyltransferase [Deferrivibrio essentukiensis]